ncbi:hypothetical protein [Tateyamaria sp. SN6-1]|uniref:hypothetical protein n=1 Tax=Tateyamaria sp. SN6-1 TaxID=3092148 RepID=UPI0039F534B0
MTLKLSKSALLIAAMATAVSLTAFTPASAKAYWASAEAETAEVVHANFKVKVKKHHKFKHKGYKHHSYKHHGFKKKKHVSKKHLTKKLILKKLF